MYRTIAALVICILLAPLPASAVTIPTVLVNNPNNENDPTDGDRLTSGIQQFGSVSYNYRIGTTEVTNAQYAEFLNAKASINDPYHVYKPIISIDPRGGIARTSFNGGFRYASKPNMADKPVVFVTWFDSVRFVNWLHNGQGAGDTETGAYTLGALDANGIPADLGIGITRNAGATWFLPSENEWYKAAYYQPAAKGGDTDDYWLYPTASNSVPTIATANAAGDISNPGVNVANFNRGADWNDQNGNVTTVSSAGPLSRGFYGTFDQGGNAGEWNESLYLDALRVYRGGSWNTSGLQSTARAANVPAQILRDVGFRVATVPEPSTLALAALGVLGLLIAARRRR